ncbi:MAG: hypothetical protein UT33_C0009G0077 [Candidatus Peregrinibacteria bacterium GW2011_GWC2_39_14]|nr:MAG: hypothetical protein US92_C0005G0077 [Candidatus Peregrinibacteria bacterium GW2011_GWA2_38_36]KKR06626.1 MAG: hypothetical protein UT33_C0009G0077 [Candidatus Peregrinibacteria bacterium GW2011_GWC2_39_14]
MKKAIIVLVALVAVGAIGVAVYSSSGSGLKGSAIGVTSNNGVQTVKLPPVPTGNAVNVLAKMQKKVILTVNNQYTDKIEISSNYTYDKNKNTMVYFYTKGDYVMGKDGPDFAGMFKDPAKVVATDKSSIKNNSLSLGDYSVVAAVYNNEIGLPFAVSNIYKARFFPQPTNQFPEGLLAGLKVEKINNDGMKVTSPCFNPSGGSLTRGLIVKPADSYSSPENGMVNSSYKVYPFDSCNQEIWLRGAGSWPEVIALVYDRDNGKYLNEKKLIFSWDARINKVPDMSKATDELTANLLAQKLTIPQFPTTSLEKSSEKGVLVVKAPQNAAPNEYAAYVSAYNPRRVVYSSWLNKTTTPAYTYWKSGPGLGISTEGSGSTGDVTVSVLRFNKDTGEFLGIGKKEVDNKTYTCKNGHCSLNSDYK